MNWGWRRAIDLLFGLRTKESVCCEGDDGQRCAFGDASYCNWCIEDDLRTLESRSRDFEIGMHWETYVGSKSWDEPWEVRHFDAYFLMACLNFEG